MANYSKQCEAVLKSVRAVHSHPTAYEIYDMVKKEIPNVSLGTVYRNLASLSGDGEITAISVGDGNVRYDGNIKSHLHLICTGCGEIEDVSIDSRLEELENNAKKSSFAADHGVYIIYGLCKNCQEQ